MDLATDLNAIESKYQDEAPEIRVRLTRQEIVGCSWPCIRLLGSAEGVRFVKADLRGAMLNELVGAEYFRCALFGATLADGARVVDCQMSCL